MVGRWAESKAALTVAWRAALMGRRTADMTVENLAELMVARLVVLTAFPRVVKLAIEKVVKTAVRWAVQSVAWTVASSAHHSEQQLAVGSVVYLAGYLVGRMAESWEF